MLRVVIQDRRRLYRDGLELFLQAEPDVAVVGTAARVEDVERLCAGVEPDVAVVQLDGVEPVALELIERLHVTWPQLRVVALCTSPSEKLRTIVHRAGAAAVCDPAAGALPVLEAVRGRSARAAVVALKAEVVDVADRPTAPSEARLTVRERQVLELVAAGATDAEVSACLGVDAEVLERLKVRLFVKLGVDSQSTAVAVAMGDRLATAGAGGRRSDGSR